MSGMEKHIQAKHLDDTEFLNHVWECQHIPVSWIVGPHWVNWNDIEPAYPGVPPGVIYAKARALIRRGLLGGCVHDGKTQCRGDLELTPKGIEFISP